MKEPKLEDYSCTDQYRRDHEYWLYLRDSEQQHKKDKIIDTTLLTIVVTSIIITLVAILYQLGTVNHD